MECEKCGEEFKSKFNLQRHSKICRGREYECLDCDKKFKTSYGRSKHEKVCTARPSEGTSQKRKHSFEESSLF